MEEAERRSSLKPVKLTIDSSDISHKSKEDNGIMRQISLFANNFKTSTHDREMTQEATPPYMLTSASARKKLQLHIDINSDMENSGFNSVPSVDIKRNIDISNLEKIEAEIGSNPSLEI
jgi:hypothetical protein